MAPNDPQRTIHGMEEDMDSCGAAPSTQSMYRQHIRPNALDVSVRQGDADEVRAARDRAQILNSPTFRNARRTPGGTRIPDERMDTRAPAQSPSSATRARLMQPSPVVFLDWDDTVLPTSWLAAAEQRTRHISSVRMDLLPIANATQTLLEECYRIGCHVSIVTNADRGWVEETCTIFFPSLVYLICPDENAPPASRPHSQIPPQRVVSARHCFEELHPHQPTAWKAGTFAWELHLLMEARSGLDGSVSERRPSSDYATTGSPMTASLENSSVSSATTSDTARTDMVSPSQIDLDSVARNAAGMPICSQLISIGDSDHEHEACHLVAGQFHTKAKTMHLARRPTPDVIQRQLEMITRSLESFVAVPDAVDVDVDI